MELKRRNKVKCAHCQGVHHHKLDCEEILELKRFCGHDSWQREQDLKEAKRKKRELKKVA